MLQTSRGFLRIGNGGTEEPGFPSPVVRHLRGVHTTPPTPAYSVNVGERERGGGGESRDLPKANSIRYPLPPPRSPLLLPSNTKCGQGKHEFSLPSSPIWSECRACSTHFLGSGHENRPSSSHQKNRGEKEKGDAPERRCSPGWSEERERRRANEEEDGEGVIVVYWRRVAQGEEGRERTGVSLLFWASPSSSFSASEKHFDLKGGQIYWRERKSRRRRTLREKVIGGGGGERMRSCVAPEAISLGVLAADGGRGRRGGYLE